MERSQTQRATEIICTVALFVIKEAISYRQRKKLTNSKEYEQATMVHEFWESLSSPKIWEEMYSHFK